VIEVGIKLTTYFSERQRSGEQFLADALFDLYERHRMRTSLLFRGAAGFGQHHHLHTDRLLSLSEALPAVSIAIDTSERIEGAVADVTRLVGHGLITLERASVITGAGFGRLERPPEGAGRATKLTLYGGRSARAGGQTGYVAAIELLRQAGVLGASVLLGVDGTLHGERRRARFFGRNAGVPLMLLAVGDWRSLAAVLPRLTELIDDPVATIERVQICKSGGVLLAEPHPPAERDSNGLATDLKLTVHAAEQSTHGRHPLHVELIQRLREAGAPGATLLRGVRGFYGDRGPFADRVLSLRRNVPVHVVVVDRPGAFERWWPIIDELTREDGIVTAELVPASHMAGAGRRARLQLTPTPES
jgi:PII-like signaling protein